MSYTDSLTEGQCGLGENGKIEIDQLRQDPFSYVLCYPKPDPSEVEKRISELSSLGVGKIIFTGKKRIGRLNVLGKGCIGIVVKAYKGRMVVALKIRRVDADRQDMSHEAKMLQRANYSSIGPSLLSYSHNFLLMKFIDGTLISEWMKNIEPDRKNNAQKVLRKILEQCYHLDRNGLDHGELTNASKHIIINNSNKVTIIDFESASTTRRPNNLTGICQYLFLRKGYYNLKECEFKPNPLLKALKEYKREFSEENFNTILHTLNLK
ncbi:RIO1 family regulatory kinase/ATPase domain-containing protein [[Eubacterium] cellulosolvens]